MAPTPSHRGFTPGAGAALTADQLRARQATVTALLAETQHLLVQAQAAVDRARATYRATSDGMAQCLRSVERAQMTPGTPAGDVRRLMRLLAAAEVQAADDYQARCRRWGHRGGDGQLRACPMGGDVPFQQLIVSADVLGTYLHDPTDTAKTITVRLSLPTPQRIRRTRLTIPATLRSAGVLTLYDVLHHAWATPQLTATMTRFLGADLNAALHAAT